MTDREKELQNSLDGLDASTPKPFWKLAEILELQVLEIDGLSKDKATDCLIPYMMNDAVENYLILKDCKMTGEYVKEKEVLLPAHLVKKDMYILVVRQEGGTLFTLQFSKIQEHLQCYQYHQIGHFWVKGQEQWRQLVYMLGTIHDKYEYIGENVCNDREKELMPLIEFPPLRDFSPIHESLDGKYPFTYDGMDRMERLAEEAGDPGYARLVRLYRRLPVGWIGKILRNRLNSPKSERLCRLIKKKLEEASQDYAVREYDSSLNEEIDRKRKAVNADLLEKGFHGKYPEYEKGNMQIIVTEEHPFVRKEFEYENYEFAIKFMVSEVDKGQSEYLGGFFQGNGRNGWIAEDVNEL